MGSLVSIDEATKTWEILEYASVQVWMLKPHNARVSKSFRINGIVYTFTSNKRLQARKETRVNAPTTSMPLLKVSSQRTHS